MIKELKKREEIIRFLCDLVESGAEEQKSSAAENEELGNHVSIKTSFSVFWIFMYQSINLSS